MLTEQRHFSVDVLYRISFKSAGCLGYEVYGWLDKTLKEHIKYLTRFQNVLCLKIENVKM